MTILAPPGSDECPAFSDPNVPDRDDIDSSITCVELEEMFHTGGL